jgi:hypothetical protein
LYCGISSIHTAQKWDSYSFSLYGTRVMLLFSMSTGISIMALLSSTGDAFTNMDWSVTTEVKQIGMVCIMSIANVGISMIAWK